MKGQTVPPGLVVWGKQKKADRRQTSWLILKIRSGIWQRNTRQNRRLITPRPVHKLPPLQMKWRERSGTFTIHCLKTMFHSLLSRSQLSWQEHSPSRSAVGAFGALLRGVLVQWISELVSYMMEYDLEKNWENIALMKKMTVLRGTNYPSCFALRMASKQDVLEPKRNSSVPYVSTHLPRWSVLVQHTE